MPIAKNDFIIESYENPQPFNIIHLRYKIPKDLAVEIGLALMENFKVCVSANIGDIPIAMYLKPKVELPSDNGKLN